MPEKSTTGGSVVLVTGASSGIGRATAIEMARRGWHVLVGFGRGQDRAAAIADALQQRFGVHAAPVGIDLHEPDAAITTLNAAVASVPEAWGQLHCLVNNAGINDRTLAQRIPTERAVEVLTVDALSPIMLASAFARHLIDRGISGSIVNVTSVHDTIPITGGILYCSAKAALGMATKVMALEFAPHGIRVNSVAPGETATPMSGFPDGPDGHALTRPAIPQGRAGRPEEIAEAVAFLAGPESSYTTGASLTIDGGLVLTAAEENARAAGRHLSTQEGPR